MTKNGVWVARGLAAGGAALFLLVTGPIFERPGFAALAGSAQAAETGCSGCSDSGSEHGGGASKGRGMSGSHPGRRGMPHGGSRGQGGEEDEGHSGSGVESTIIHGHGQSSGSSGGHESSGEHESGGEHESH